MTSTTPRPPRTARQVTLSAVFLGVATLATIAGILIAVLAGVDPLGPVIMIGVFMALLVTFMPFVARGRAPWVIPLVGAGVIVVGWSLVLGIWHLTT